MTPLQDYTADHRYLLELAGSAAGLAEPIAVDLDVLEVPLMKAARKGRFIPVDGVLVRDWDPFLRKSSAGVNLGMRLFEVEGIPFVQVRFCHDEMQNREGLMFAVIARKDYRRLYRVALRLLRDMEPPAEPPVLAPAPAEQLWQNTIGYLDVKNLDRIRAFGGRPRRGVLLTGAPGNGKTMACRWLWEECRQRNWDWRVVTPDDYRQARNSCNAAAAVQALFTVEKRGIVFFDDMDLALRDRESVRETEDQAVFLTALDGISVKQGVVFIFTTNCNLDLIDRAFKRPGRIDLVLHFDAPNAELRRQLLERWHPEVRLHLDLARAVADTHAYSFAEIEELKNLLIMHYLDHERWDWDHALAQFDVNRLELATRRQRQVGFGSNGLGTASGRRDESPRP